MLSSSQTSESASAEQQMFTHIKSGKRLRLHLAIPFHEFPRSRLQSQELGRQIIMSKSKASPRPRPFFEPGIATHCMLLGSRVYDYGVKSNVIKCHENVVKMMKSKLDCKQFLGWESIHFSLLLDHQHARVKRRKKLRVQQILQSR